MDDYKQVEDMIKISCLEVMIKEAHWLIEYARCQGEYGLGEEWQARYEAWKKEVGV